MEDNKDGKSFFESVYEITEKIPYGMVVSYGQIARALNNPKASRIVGYAMLKAPAGRNLPCHRVVKKDGGLAPEYAFGSKEFQRIMLIKEGVTFDPQGNVNMERHTWDICLN